MELLFEIMRFLIYLALIVFVSKNILVKTIRNLAKNLNLKPKTVGNIAGIATSVPELLTISASSFKGLANASIYNVLSSNVINVVQYSVSIILNKNQKKLNNIAIKVNIILVIITIILPIFFALVKSELKLNMVPILIFLYFGFKKINNNIHKLYLKKEDKQMYNSQIKYNIGEKENRKRVIADVCILIVTGIFLFIIGNLLGNTLELLCGRFNVSEMIVGIILGFVTSIPELITFFESQKHHKSTQDDMLGIIEATNNLFVSNVMNLFIIQSIGIVIFSIF